MNHIKDYLPTFMSTLQDEKHWKLKLMSQWDIIMGSLVSKVSICQIYNNSITLGVTDSSWMQELHLLSELIKDKINSAIGAPRIEVIRFKYVAQHPSKAPKKRQQPATLLPSKVLTLREQQALKDIKDPELSKALMEFLQTCHRFS